MLSCMGPTSVTPNLWGHRWSKLIINCMNNGLAGLTGWKTARTRMHEHTQPIGIQLAAEVVRVARAHGKKQEVVMGLQPDVLVAAAEGQEKELAVVKAQLKGMADRAGTWAGEEHKNGTHREREREREREIQ